MGNRHCMRMKNRTKKREIGRDESNWYKGLKITSYPIHNSIGIFLSIKVKCIIHSPIHLSIQLHIIPCAFSIARLFFFILKVEKASRPYAFDTVFRTFLGEKKNDTQLNLKIDAKLIVMHRKLNRTVEGHSCNRKFDCKMASQIDGKWHEMLFIFYSEHVIFIWSKRKYAIFHHIQL